MRFASIFVFAVVSIPLQSLAQSAGGSSSSGGASTPGGGSSAGGGSSLGGGRGGSWTLDPAQFQAQIIENLKAKLTPTLGENDEKSKAQWNTLLPLIEKLMEAQRSARTGAGMSFASPPMGRGTINGQHVGGPGSIAGTGPGAAAQSVGQSGVQSGGQSVTGGMRIQSGGGSNVDTPPGRAMQAIRTAVDAGDTDDAMTKKIAALHEARDKARVELLAAQQDLRAACTPRQEAVLITFGLLD